MKSLSRMILAVVTGLSVGCGGAAGGTEAGRTPVLGQPAAPRIAADAPVAAVAIPADEKPYEGPAHRFNPSSHAPIDRYAQVPRPDLRSLPKMKLKMRQCFGVEEEPRPAKIATGKKRKGAGGAGGGGFGLGSASSSRSSGSVASAPARRTKAKEKAAPPRAESSKAPAGPFAADAAGAAPSMDDMVMAEEAEAPAPSEAPMATAEDGRERKQIASDESPSVRDEDRDELPPRYEDWGAAIYLSNDDTMSLSSAQRVIYAIDHFLPLPSEHIRPHELLNYFSFETAEVNDGFDFSVLGDIAADPKQDGIYTLALAVRGRPVDIQRRRNAAITLVVDRSGSMSDEGRMDYLKRGLSRMTGQLKDGDLVNMVVFDHEVCVPVENFVVGRDKPADLDKAIAALVPRGSTDLHRGLTRGYELADSSYQPAYSNRVIMITDALANTGVTDEQMISMVSKYYDKRQVRLSGVGVGRDFNDTLLDKLTERGKGAYVFLGSAAEVDAVFGPRFISLVETTAHNVHFRLHLPPSLRMNVFYGEESSTVKADVQEIHYFANTSQLFLSDLMARGGVLRPQDEVMLTIEYEDPANGRKLVEESAFELGRISNDAFNVRKGRLVMAWVDLLAQMAARPAPGGYFGGEGGWVDEAGWRRCDEGRVELERLSNGIAGDSETKRVLDLWTKYCSRYERPRNPVRRKVVHPDDSWPSAR